MIINGYYDIIIIVSTTGVIIMISIVLVLLLLLYLGLFGNALNILIVAGIFLSIALKYKNAFKKAYLYYIGAFIVSTLSFFFIGNFYFNFITDGIVGYGLILLVMYAGIFPNKWLLTRRLKLNRGVFSILGFIFITPHAMGHLFGLLGNINLFGIAAYVIMVPLFITSFRIIRRQINPKEWFTLHKIAYIVYVLLFIHLLLVSSWENKLIYVVILVVYANNKIVKEVSK